MCGKSDGTDRPTGRIRYAGEGERADVVREIIVATRFSLDREQYSVREGGGGVGREMREGEAKVEGGCRRSKKNFFF